MLKVANNVDLKELEKFGFKPKYDEDTGKIIRFVNTRRTIALTGGTIDKSIFTIFRSNKKWYFKCDIWGFSDDVQDILFDLIQAGILKKVKND